MMAYIFGIENSKFANIRLCEFGHSQLDRQIKIREYSHPVGHTA